MAAHHAGVEFFVVNDDQYLADWIPASALTHWFEEPIDPPLVSLDDALAIAESVLKSDDSEYDVRLVGVIDRPRHWVWGYNTVEAIETGEPGLAGQASIAVSKVDGRVRRLWSGRPIEAQL